MLSNRYNLSSKIEPLLVKISPVPVFYRSKPDRDR